MSFYKDPAQLRGIVGELLVFCRKDVAELRLAVEGGDESRQRFLLHRIEGSLGTIGPAIEGAVPLNEGASVEQRTRFIALRMAQLEALLRKLESEAIMHP